MEGNDENVADALEEKTPILSFVHKRKLKKSPSLEDLKIYEKKEVNNLLAIRRRKQL